MSFIAVRGAQEVANQLTLMAKQATAHVHIGIGMEAHAIAVTARALAPKDTGTLRAGGRVELVKNRLEQQVARITFEAFSPRGFDYAVPQHERFDYKHTTGGPQYLTRAVKMRISALSRRVEMAVQRALPSR